MGYLLVHIRGPLFILDPSAASHRREDRDAGGPGDGGDAGVGAHGDGDIGAPQADGDPARRVDGTGVTGARCTQPNATRATNAAPPAGPTYFTSPESACEPAGERQTQPASPSPPEPLPAAPRTPGSKDGLPLPGLHAGPTIRDEETPRVRAPRSLITAQSGARNGRRSPTPARQFARRRRRPHRGAEGSGAEPR